MSILLLLVPISGISAGVLLIRRRVNSIKIGEWKDELSNGFPSALKILLELDWDETFDEISAGRVGYALYGLLKAAAYWSITVFALGLLGKANALEAHVLEHCKKEKDPTKAACESDRLWTLLVASVFQKVAPVAEALT